MRFFLDFLQIVFLLFLRSIICPPFICLSAFYYSPKMKSLFRKKYLSFFKKPIDKSKIMLYNT